MTSEQTNPLVPVVTATQEEAKLLPNISTSADDFGKAIAQVNDMAIIGAPEADGNRGAAYIYKRIGDAWQFWQILHASDPNAGDHFGISVSASVNYLAIGASDDDTAAGLDAGSVYIFKRTGDDWIEAQHISASDGQASANFGRSVAALGTEIVIGAPNHDLGSGSFSGQVYMYDNDGPGWTERQKLVPSPSFSTDSLDRFGTSIAASLGTIVVGCYGIPEVFVFRPGAGGQYAQVQRLSEYAWGSDVAISGNEMVIGSPLPIGQGTANVYHFDGTSWVLEQNLSPADRGVAYGMSVQISGGLVIVGDGERAAYVYTLSGGTWSEQVRLDPPDANSEFGAEVSLFNDSLLVGDPSNVDPSGVNPSDGTHPGSAYSYFLSNGVWNGPQQFERNFQTSYDFLGNGTAIQGDIAVVGAPEVGDGTGQAFVFQRTGTSWSVIQRLAPSEPSDTEFGASVDIDGDTLAIGSENCSVYVYVRNGNAWTFQQRIGNPSFGSDFGSGVELDGDSMIVGARYYVGNSIQEGAAYIFTRSGNVWSQQQMLVSDTPQSQEQFGWDVDISGDTAVVGAWHHTEPVGVVGMSYVYIRNGNAWTLQQKLLPVNDFGSMGTGVAIKGDIIAVGVPKELNPDLNVRTGAIYVYQRSQGTWSLQQRLFAPDGATGDNLGFSVEMTSSAIAASAPFKNGTPALEPGAAYVFVLNGGTWEYTAELIPSDAQEFDELGEASSSMAIDGDTVIAGVYLASRGGLEYSGAAYAFRFGSPPPTPTPTPTPNTGTGTNVTVAPQAGDAEVTFSQVTVSGNTTFTPIDPNNAGSPPTGYTLCPTCPAYDITTTATYVPPVTVCLGVPASVDAPTFATLALLHGENGVLVDVTTQHVTNGDGTREVCGQVSSLSPFVLGHAPPPNSAPSLSNVNITSPINENGAATLTGNISDADSGDAFTLKVTWGDGSAQQMFNYPAGTTTFSENHTYLDDPTGAGSGSFQVDLILEDGAGGSDTDSTSETVNNLAPQLSNVSASPDTITVGGSTTVSGTIADASPADSFTVQIDWGDGSGNTTLNRPAGSTSFSANHQYNSAGTMTVTITLTDDDGGSANGGTSVTVNPAPSAPAAPSNLAADAISSTEIVLSWRDNSDNETNFELERCDGKGKCRNFMLLSSPGANTVTFNDTGLLPASQYSYRIRAVNIVGNSNYSNTAKTKTARR